LDAGTGFGKYGVLMREYLELWNYEGRTFFSQFKRRIDGIEGFEEYITPVHHYVYNNIFIGNIIEVIEKIDYTYDLIILVDVLEHFEKNDGKVLLKKLFTKGDVILISTPKNPVSQDDSFGNTFEAHRSRWKKRELKQLENVFFINDPIQYIVCMGNREKIKKLRRKLMLNKIQRIVQKVPYAVPTYRYFEYLLKRGG